MSVRHVATWFTLAVVAPALAGPRLVLKSHTTLSDPKDPENSVLLREIPRQALIVAATEDFAAGSVDLTLEPQATIHPDDLQLDFTRKLDPANKRLTITLLEGGGKTLAEEQITPGFSSESIVSLADVGRLSESVVNDRWREIVGKQLGVAPLAKRWSSAATQPADSERLLSTMDFTHAFLAAWQLHGAIAADGESVGRLSALSRAYINLGESLRHLIGGQADAALARGLAYANRLVRSADKDPLAYWTRAYAESLIGLPADSDADLKRAADLGGAASVPDWAAQLGAFNHCRTVELNTAATTPLSVYLAWRTVEPCKLTSAVINFGNIALGQNPGAIRILDAMTGVSGVAMHHETSENAPRALNRLVATLANDRAAPANVRDLVSAAVVERFAPPSILALLDGLEQIPAEAAMPLSFATYGSLVRDCQFVDAYRTLSFQREEWSVDPSVARDQWLDLLASYRLAAVLKSFNSPQVVVPPASVEAVNKLEFHDAGMNLCLLLEHFTAMALLNDPRTGEVWGLTAFRVADPTTWDYSIMCSRFRGRDGGPSRSVARLESIAPDQPMILAAKLDWQVPAVMAKLDEIEKASSENPIINYSLGNALNGIHRPDDALRVLKPISRSTPDFDVFWAMAHAYALKNDPAGWITNWDNYLKDGADYGLHKPQAGQYAALALRSRGEIDRSLKYSQVAADSYSGWGLLTHAYGLARAGQYEPGWQLMTDVYERYGEGFHMLPFCIATGHGDLRAATQAADQIIAWRENSDDWKTDVSMLETLEGKTDQARRHAKAGLTATKSRYSAVIAALADLDGGDRKAALADLESVKDGESQSPGEAAYKVTVDELIGLIGDNKRLPPHSPPLVQSPELTLIDQTGQPIANGCYAIGRACELSGKLDEAKYWYHESVDQPSDMSILACNAAAALRRLGADVYPKEVPGH